MSAVRKGRALEVMAAEYDLSFWYSGSDCSADTYVFGMYMVSLLGKQFYL